MQAGSVQRLKMRGFSQGNSTLLLQCAFACLMGLLSVFAHAHASDLRAGNLGLHWDHRLVVVFEGQGSSVANQQVGQMQAAMYQWRDRDLVLITVQSGAVSGVHHDGQLSESQVSAILALNGVGLVETYKVPDRQPHVILIGKDGGVKLRDNKAFSNAVLFGTIDVMPMRQREMDTRINLRV